MDGININDVKQIKITFSDDNQVIFKEKGLEHFRRLILKSPAYGSTVVPVEEAPKKKKKKKDSSAGYSVVNLEYGSKDSGKGSAVSQGEAMRLQAEAAGFKFG